MEADFEQDSSANVDAARNAGAAKPLLIENGIASYLVRGKSEQFQIYCARTGKQSVVLVQDPAVDAGHKYIIAETSDGHQFVVAAPYPDLAEYHKHILAAVKDEVGEDVKCCGGGYAGFGTVGQVYVSGSSSDFGQGDHPLAVKAFSKAITGKELSQVEFLLDRLPVDDAFELTDRERNLEVKLNLLLESFSKNDLALTDINRLYPSSNLESRSWQGLSAKDIAEALFGGVGAIAETVRKLQDPRIYFDRMIRAAFRGYDKQLAEFEVVKLMILGALRNARRYSGIAASPSDKHEGGFAFAIKLIRVSAELEKALGPEDLIELRLRLKGEEGEKI